MKDCLYKQIDDIAMISSLGSTLANFFLEYMETKILDSCECRPKLYATLMDDFFAAFNTDSSSLDFYKFSQFSK